MLLYADNIVMLAHSALNVKIKQKLLENYFKQNELVVNTSKIIGLACKT